MRIIPNGGLLTTGIDVLKEDQDPERIKEEAKHLDDALESRDIENVLPFFSESCRIEMLGIELEGREGARKWLQWLFSTLDDIRFEPVTIMVEGDTFFEEFVLRARLKNGIRVESKQAEVLVYKDYKVESLRLYFDRLDFAEAVGSGPVRKSLINMIRNTSLKNLK